MSMTSEERQKTRIAMLEDVNKAEAEFYAARDESEALRRRQTDAQNRTDEKRRVLVKMQEQLRGFLLDPS